MRRTPALAAVLLALVTAVTSTAVTGVPAAEAGTGSSRAAAVGQPRVNYVPTSRPYFAYPKSKRDRMVIRNRVLRTIQSTWGGPRTRAGLARSGNGTIRIATWSFKDWAVAKALVAARNRGVSVQVVAAKSANQGSGPWRYLRQKLGTRLYKAGHPTTRELVSFARSCRGACRGPGGTPHAKYFLFDKVGSSRTRYITIQSSMNLTEFAYTNQWNQAQVMKSKSVYDDFVYVYRQARRGHPVSQPYRARQVAGAIVDYFFPRTRARAAQDPVMEILNRVACTGAGSGGNASHHTRLRIIQYAMYGDRGVWIAKKLRNLWGRGCDIKIIYSLMTRPVLQILRHRSGRGAIPMRQSVTKNGGVITSYNHSKWMTITGRWSPNVSNWITFTGSANWSLLAFASDEQMQRIHSRANALLYMQAFNKTWGQKTSKRPPGGRLLEAGRTTPIPGVPEDAPAWGEGAYRYMTP
jgi:hypothetical protein